MKFQSILAMFIITLFTGPISAQNNMSNNRAQGVDGSALVAELCTKCHNLDEVVRLRQSREAWEDTVYSMVGRGAPIFPDEIDVIINYLSSVYGPDAAL
jgi:hypothetical protein